MAEATSAEHRRVSLVTRIAYGFGAISFGVKDNGFKYLLLFYYDQVLGLPVLMAGLAIMFAFVVDSIWDPTVGFFSDQLRTRWGRRHPLMYAAALPVAASYFLLWNPPAGLSDWGLFAWLALVSIGVRALITLYETPSTALVAELTDDYDERTRLLSLRYFFGWWGGLTVAVLAYQVLLPAGGGQLAAGGYRTYGVIGSLIMLFAMLASGLGTHREIPRLRQPPLRARRSVREAVLEVRESLASPSFLPLLGGGVFYSMAAGLSAALSIYLATYFWSLTSEQIGLMNLPYYGSAAAALVIAPALSRRLGKKRAAIGASVAMIGMAPLAIGLRFAGWFPENDTSALFWTLLTIYALEVVLLICSASLLSAMIADVVEESELVTGRRSEGVFFAARSFIDKSVSGLGIMLSAFLIFWIGRPGEGDPAERAAMIARLGAGYACSAVVLYSVAIACYSRYRLSRKQHALNLEQLAARGATRIESIQPGRAHG
ncbi:MAG TPA: MFS transporter [Myxococcota bacterium]|nr:MFS transporter [Myxococcota bacterium]